MKYLHYDIEGDILDVTFADGQPNVGVELSDNIVLYYNSQTHEALKLIVLSYQALLQASKNKPVLLDGLASMPIQVQQTVISIIQHPPVASFLYLEELSTLKLYQSHLCQIFIPTWESANTKGNQEMITPLPSLVTAEPVKFH
jgi:hypothetical protein